MDTGETGRFRKFGLDEIRKRDYKLDVAWLKDESLEENGELPDPQDLAAEAITELEAVVDDLREIVALVEKEEGVEK
jgi:type I restriction enzyme M protein